jgi:hypothetical protein
MIRGAQPGVWVLRAVIVVGTMLGLLTGIPEGHVPRGWIVVLVAAGALLSAFRPEHLSLSITMGLVVVWWAFQLRGDMPVAVLVAAAGLTATHAAAVMLGYGPPSLPVDPQLALLWAARGVLTWVASLVVWGVARTYTGHGTPALFWLSGLAAALVGAVAAGAAVPLRGQGSRG